MSREGRKITFTAIADQALSEDAEEALSVAATEIVADFPESEISEQIIISSEPLPRENINAEGWVFRRRELG